MRIQNGKVITIQIMKQMSYRKTLFLVLSLVLFTLNDLCGIIPLVLSVIGYSWAENEQENGDRLQRIKVWIILTLSLGAICFIAIFIKLLASGASVLKLL